MKGRPAAHKLRAKFPSNPRTGRRRRIIDAATAGAAAAAVLAHHVATEAFVTASCIWPGFIVFRAEKALGAPTTEALGLMNENLCGLTWMLRNSVSVACIYDAQCSNSAYACREQLKA